MEKSISANGLSPALLLWSGLFTRCRSVAPSANSFAEFAVMRARRIRPYQYGYGDGCIAPIAAVSAAIFSIDDRVAARDLHAQRKLRTGPISVSIDRIAILDHDIHHRRPQRRSHTVDIRVQRRRLRVIWARKLAADGFDGFRI